MKTLYLTYSGSICLDSEMNPKLMPSKIESIHRIFLITEPTKVVYASGEKTEEIYADVDDIVIEFYRDDFKHRIVVAKSAEWVDNIKDYDEKEQKSKEEWAAKHKECEESCMGCADLNDSPCKSNR